jgi:hypothetical protein
MSRIAPGVIVLIGTGYVGSLGSVRVISKSQTSDQRSFYIVSEAFLPPNKIQGRFSFLMPTIYRNGF